MKIDKIEIIPMTPQSIFEEEEQIDEEHFGYTQDINEWEAIHRFADDLILTAEDIELTKEIQHKFKYFANEPTCKVGTNIVEVKTKEFKTRKEITSYLPKENEALLYARKVQIYNKEFYFLRSANLILK